MKIKLNRTNLFGGGYSKPIRRGLWRKLACDFQDGLRAAMGHQLYTNLYSDLSNGLWTPLKMGVFAQVSMAINERGVDETQP